MRSGVAIVGASDNNFWTGHALRNLGLFGYQGEIWPVNPNYAEVAGLPAYPSLGDIDGTLDAVVVAVAAHRCPDIVRQAVALGGQDLVVVADGFAERDPDGPGAALQRELVAACQPGTRLYGPNCVGFADFRRRLCAIAEPLPLVEEPGDISVVSQSGAVVSSVMAGILEDGGGLDWCVSLGNAAQFGVASAIDYACERGSTRVICLYIESLGREPDRLRAALARADDQGVRVVMLKSGRTDRSARIALSHTASVAGDDVQVDAFLQAHGVLRVDSFDELARVAVLARLGRRASQAAAPSSVVIIGSSGGQAAVASDLATRDGLDLAPLTGTTRKVLVESVAPGSFTENPLDLIGRPGAKGGIGQVYSAVFSDETVGFALSPWSVVFPDDSDGRRTHRASLQLAADSARESGTPTVISSLTLVPWTDWVLALRRDNPHIAVVRGIDMTIRALSRLFPAPPGPAAEPHATAPAGDRAAVLGEAVVGEIEGRQILGRLGLPVAAGHVAASADEAARLMRELPAPVVVKVDLRGVPHKDQVGAVTVGCRTADDVRRAVQESYRQMAEHGIGAGQVLGLLVEEQLTGTEVLVGLSHSGLGRFVTIGTGGTRAGRGSAARTVLLPATRADLEQAAAPFLLPARAGDPGVVAAVDLLERLCAEFETGGLTGYSTVEVNPLFVSTGRAAIADVLLVPA
jgi:acyl-CoA synthetase (NDP forming)